MEHLRWFGMGLACDACGLALAMTSMLLYDVGSSSFWLLLLAASVLFGAGGVFIIKAAREKLAAQGQGADVDPDR